MPDSSDMLAAQLYDVRYTSLRQTLHSPVVHVPVLSRITISTSVVKLYACLSLINNPLLAAIDVLLETTKGIARPNACGHAITSVVTAKLIPVLTFSNNVQTTNAITAAISAI